MSQYTVKHDDGGRRLRRPRTSLEPATPVQSTSSTSSFNLTEALHMDFEVGLRPNKPECTNVTVAAVFWHAVAIVRRRRRSKVVDIAIIKYWRQILVRQVNISSF